MKTYTAEEAKKAIWREIMKVRKTAQKTKTREQNWISRIDLPNLKHRFKLFFDQNLYRAFNCYHATNDLELSALHIAQNKDGCNDRDKFAKTLVICWHRRGPDEFVRSEHLPYAEDAPCRS